MLKDPIILGKGSFCAAGKEWPFYPLDIADRLEMKEKWGILDKNAPDAADNLFEQAIDVLWMGMRKSGKTPDDLDRHDYAITRNEVMRLFKADEFDKLLLVANDVAKLGRPTPIAPTTGAAPIPTLTPLPNRT